MAAAVGLFAQGGVFASEGNANYLGVLSATAPTGFTPSPSWYSIAQGQKTLTFSTNVTNLTDGTQAMNLQLDLDHITTYPVNGVQTDISDGQPGVINGAVVDGQFNETLATEVQDPNATITPISIAPHATVTLTFTRTLTACGYYQVDVFKQGLANQTGLTGFEIRVLGCGTPSISTIATPTSGFVGTPISDTATVTGGINPTGTVSFSLFAPGDTTCSTDISGSSFKNIALSAGQAGSPSYTTTQTGVYRWIATYNGDVNNVPVSSTCASEQVVILPTTPVIRTTASPTTGIVGVSIHDTAIVSGGFNPTGTVTFALYGPGDATCTGTNLVAGMAGFANVALVAGSATSPDFATSSVGTYNWVATYNGDSNNNAVTSPCGAEQVIITKPLGNQGCTPGFWKNPKHFALWTGYSPTQLVSSVFVVPATFPDGSDGTSLSSSTLAQALAFQGGSTLNGASQILLRAAVAGLLNSTSSGVAYPMTTAQIISSVDAALASGDRNTIVNLAAQIDAANNGLGGCPLS